MAKIKGNGKDNTLTGTPDSDTIDGKGGNDTLSGLAGDDILDGGKDADLLTGGSGEDRFVYRHKNDSPDGVSQRDTISDFTALGDAGLEKDKIDLSALSGPDLAWGGTSAVANGVWYTQSGGNTIVNIDLNGSPASPEMQIVLQGLHTLVAADFVGVVSDNNAAPTTDDVLIDTNQGTAIIGQLGAADPDGGVLAFSIETGPLHGTLEIDPDGSYTYTPAAGYFGSDVFTFRVTDAGGLSVTGEADVTVSPVTSQVRYLPIDQPTDFDEAVTVNSAEELGVSQVTALADGGHLVVWSTLDLDPEFPGMAVFAQRYDASGQKVGGEFQVNTTTGWGNNLRPSVAGFSDGGFVVTWEVYSEDPASPGFDIFGQRFDASGNPVGGEFLVNQSTESQQNGSTVRALNDGNFVVTWNDWNPDSGTWSYDTYARVFAPDAGGANAVTDEFRVNTDIIGDQSTSATIAEPVTVLAGGRFVAVWTGLDGSEFGVFARVYEADGTAVNADEVPVNTTTDGNQNTASVGALAEGGFVVTWSGPDGSSHGIFAQRFDADGNAVGAEFAVNTWTDGLQDASKIISLSDGGFVIAWMSYGAQGDGAYAITGQRYDSAGNAVGDEFIINTAEIAQDLYPSLALREDGALIATWTNYRTRKIEQKIIDDFSTDVRPLPGPLDETVNTHSGSGIDYSEVTALADGGHLVVWSTVSLEPDDSEWGVFAQRYDASGQKVGGEFLVNTYTLSEQIHPSAAGLPDGGFVVTWESLSQSPDSSDHGVFGQLFDASGNKIGGEFLVNQETLNEQFLSTVSALADGNFVVTWSGYDSEAGFRQIYARVFAPGAGGAIPVTDEFIVSADTIGGHNYGEIAETVTGLNNGRFVVVWSAAQGEAPFGENVYARVYEADGTAVTASQIVNATVGSQYIVASVGALDDGGFVVVWEDDDATTNVFAQRFDADGNTVGDEFVVNTPTPLDQHTAKISALSDGGFVIVWMSEGVLDEFTYSLAGQRYDSTGNEVGGAFVVNSSLFGAWVPSLALRDDGALVVTWTNFDTQDIEQKIITSFDPTAAAKDLTGGPGNDSFLGSQLIDTLDGAGGDDRLAGLGGDDTIEGGPGSDTIVFNIPSDGIDTIIGFVSGVDRLEISAAGFGHGLVAGGDVTLVTAVDAASAFNAGADGYFIFDNDGVDAGKVYWDETGGSGADAVAIAELLGVASLLSSDFILA